SISEEGGYNQGFPRLNVSEAGPVGDVLILSHGEVQSLGRPFDLKFTTGLENLQTGPGDNYVRVVGSNNFDYGGLGAEPNTISLGGGNNTIVLGTAAGHFLGHDDGFGDVAVNAGSGTRNTLYVTAAGETLSGAYRLSAGSISGSAYGVKGFNISYGTSPGGA